MLKVGEVKMIRHMVLNQGKSIREASRETGRSRNTVRKYLNQPEPEYRKKKPSARPVFELVKPRIDAILEEWKDRTTPKQRITGTRIHRQLLKEGYRVGITIVRDYLRELRLKKAEVYIPLQHYPGDEAQVDFFQITADILGKRKKFWMFVMRLMYSGRDFAWVYEHCDQVSFLDAHVKAFEYFGAVSRRLVYDNLKAAVKRRVGIFPELTDRFNALSSHYLFEPCFARIGEGHDKGGVESRGKGIRLRHLTPVPEGKSLDEISRNLQANLEEESRTKRDKQGKSVKERFEQERALMLPLPDYPFEARLPIFTTASKTSTIRIDCAEYSVPCRWARLDVTAYLGVSDIRVVCRGEEEILDKAPRGQRKILYRHYLRELSRKPQAVRQVAPDLVRELGSPFDLFWRRLLDGLSPLESARVFCRVLGMILDYGEERIRKALWKLLEGKNQDLLFLTDALRRESSPVSVPPTLSQYRIESSRAADYDALLKGGVS